MPEPLLIKRIEETRKALADVPEFAKMTLRFRNGKRVVYPKILTKLTFPTAGIMMIVKHDTDEPELVIINMNMVGDGEDIVSVSMVDLPPEEVTNEIM